MKFNDGNRQKPGLFFSLSFLESESERFVNLIKGLGKNLPRLIDSVDQGQDTVTKKQKSEHIKNKMGKTTVAPAA
ncbi:MAG: hypothetical protein QHH44_10185 [Candidatus Saccharicenans sp.]|jgi:hypothetical protein|nr:hypothetical protein [Candidatus Saccharicenans sp.]